MLHTWAHRIANIETPVNYALMPVAVCYRSCIICVLIIYYKAGKNIVRNHKECAYGYELWP